MPSPIPCSPISPVLLLTASSTSGDGMAKKKKHSINPANFFNPNSTWR